MQKGTQRVVEAFLEGKARTEKNTKTDGKAIYLNGRKIVGLLGGNPQIKIFTLAGEVNDVTCERINGIIEAVHGQKSAKVQQKGGVARRRKEVLNPVTWYRV